MPGERPQYRLNFETAFTQSRCVAGDILRKVRALILQRRRGLRSAIGKTPVLEMGRSIHDLLRQLVIYTNARKNAAQVRGIVYGFVSSHSDRKTSNLAMSATREANNSLFVRCIRARVSKRDCPAAQVASFNSEPGSSIRQIGMAYSKADPAVPSYQVLPRYRRLYPAGGQ